MTFAPPTRDRVLFAKAWFVSPLQGPKWIPLYMPGDLCVPQYWTIIAVGQHDSETGTRPVEIEGEYTRQELRIEVRASHIN